MRWIGQMKGQFVGRKTRARQASVWLMGAMMVIAVGCGGRQPPVATQPPAPPPKPVAVNTPPPPPPLATKPSAPTIDTFTADPTRMERGQSATLRWAVRGATEVTIDQGLGAVQPSGSRQVFPSSTLTYTLTARSSVGEVTRSVTVEVVTAPPPPAPPKSGGNISERMSQLSDVHFAYDSSEISSDNQAILRQDAQLLRQIFMDFPTLTLVVEGHCDERGSSEYNLALGDRRAITTRDALVALGIPGDRIRTLSYGEERPVCTDTNEACYQENRRAHFAPGQ